MPWYIIYRMMSLAFVLFAYISHLVTMDNNERRFYPIYFSHWLMTIILAFELADSILILNELRKAKKQFSPRYPRDLTSRHATQVFSLSPLI